MTNGFTTHGLDAEPPIRWTIRLSNRADSEITAARQYFSRTAGEALAEEWQSGLRAEIAKLAQFPGRLPLASENNLFSETVHVLLYRRTRSSAAYRALFVLRQSADDAPTVSILHIRHAAQKPMTRKEAREIEASE